MSDRQFRLLQEADRTIDALRSQVATLEAERDRLRGIWESLDGSLKSVRHHMTTKGGQHVGIPDMLGLAQVPSMLIRLERLCRDALAALDTPAPPRCETWCGTHTAHAGGRPVVYSDFAVCYCSKACRDAGRPLHPPTHGTQGMDPP